MADIQHTFRDLIGRRIVHVRAMTRREAEREGWWPFNVHGAPPVLVLDDGARLYPARDAEGNGPGTLFVSAGGGHAR